MTTRLRDYETTRPPNHRTTKLFLVLLSVVLLSCGPLRGANANVHFNLTNYLAVTDTTNALVRLFTYTGSELVPIRILADTAAEVNGVVVTVTNQQLVSVRFPVAAILVELNKAEQVYSYTATSTGQSTTISNVAAGDYTAAISTTVALKTFAVRVPTVAGVTNLEAEDLRITTVSGTPPLITSTVLNGYTIQNSTITNCPVFANYVSLYDSEGGIWNFALSRDVNGNLNVGTEDGYGRIYFAVADGGIKWRMETDWFTSDTPIYATNGSSGVVQANQLSSATLSVSSPVTNLALSSPTATNVTINRGTIANLTSLAATNVTAGILTVTTAISNAPAIHGTNVYVQNALRMYDSGGSIWNDALVKDGNDNLQVGSEGFTGIRFGNGDPGFAWEMNTDYFRSDTPIYSTNGNLGRVAANILTIIEGGAAATMGTNRLTAGGATVSTTRAVADARIFLSTLVPGGTVGYPYISSISAGTSFVITNTSLTDTSIVAWLIIDPTP